MNRKIWRMAVEVLEIFLNFTVIFCLETAVFYSLQLAGRELDQALPVPGMIRQCLLVLVPLAYLLLREKAQHFWTFVLLHVLTAAAVVLLLGRTVPERRVYCLFSGGYLFLSFRKRFAPVEDDWNMGGEPEQRQMRREEPPSLFLHALAAAGTFALCVYVGSQEGCVRIIRAVLVYTLLYLADLYLRHLEQFLQFNRASNAHIPVRKILVRGGGLTGISSLFVVALLGMFADHKLIQSIGRGLKAVWLVLLRLIVRAVSWLMSLFSGREGGGTAEQGEMLMQELEAAQEAASPVWLEILLTVLQYALLIAAAAFACWSLYRLIQEAVRRFYGKRAALQGEEEQAQEVREKLERRGRREKRRDRLPVFAGTPDEKIRRIYKRTIRRLGRELNPGKTARELILPQNREDSLKENPDCLELAQLYEKARYRGNCLREEAEEARNCSERILNPRRS